MSNEQCVTLGEIYRILVAQGRDISEIKADVKAQNGRVNCHETRITVLEDRGTRDTAARATGIGAALASAATFLYGLFK